MKKSILILSFIISILSCSKSDDDNSEKQLAVTKQNLAGQWNFETITRFNGSSQTFHSYSCTTVNDYADINSIGNIYTYNYGNNCVASTNNGCSQFNLDSNNRIINCGLIFGDARVTELTATRLKIEYDTPKDLGFMCDILDAKSILFLKRP